MGDPVFSIRQSLSWKKYIQDSMNTIRLYAILLDQYIVALLFSKPGSMNIINITTCIVLNWHTLFYKHT